MCGKIIYLLPFVDADASTIVIRRQLRKVVLPHFCNVTTGTKSYATCGSNNW